MGEAADETFSPPPPVAAPRTAEPTSPKSAARRRWTRVASQRTLSDAPAAAPQTGKRVTKVVYLARHGEGVHEIAAEVERDVAHAAALARDPAAEKPAELADPAGEEFFNAGLTDRGRAQTARAAQELDALLARPHYPRPEAFFASPLHRTLETATILADGRVEVPVVAVDALREQRGGLPCDERDRADVVAADFPTVDASAIAAADDASPDGYVLREALVEDEAALAARAGEAVAWLRSLPFESVCLVAHRRLLRAVVRHTGPWLQARDARGGELEEVFPASEVRVVRVTWGASGLLERVVARSLGDAMRDSDAETFAAFERARAALGAVRNDALAAEVDALKARALDALFAGGDAGDRAAADAFQRVKRLAGEESARLSALLGRVMDAYKLLGERYRFLTSPYNVTYDDLLDKLCAVGLPGEMFTSAAPQDPIFWPLHGNAERFLQYVRLLNETGNITLDATWGYEHQTHEGSDTHVVCDWSQVDATDVTSMPVCRRDTCPGHKADDLLPYASLTDTQVGLYTNEEFYELTAPNSPDLTYVYNSLSYWPGCSNNHTFTVEYPSPTFAPTVNPKNERRT